MPVVTMPMSVTTIDRSGCPRCSDLRAHDGPKRAAEIEDFRLHDTRHTFASRLAMEGVDLLAINVLGGWKSLTMVQRYAHLSPGHQRSAIERLVTRQRVSETADQARTE